MSITGIRELLSRSDASGSKSTILKPLTWFLALIIGGILTLLKFGSPIWLTIMLAVIFCLGVAVFFFVYIYRLINDRDSLRSEKFTIQKLAIEKGIMGDDVTGIAPLSNNRQPNECNSRLSKEDGI